MSLVSIITPLYNSESYLSLTLDSIIKQTIEDWECIIVDDGSHDYSVAIAQRYVAYDKRFRLIQQENKGPSAARNLGYGSIDSETEFVTFMDSDDIWLPNALEILIKALRDDVGAVAANGIAEYIDSEGNIFLHGERRQQMLRRVGLRAGKLQVLQPQEATTFDSLFTGSSNFPPGLVLTRRRNYDLIGGFDEKLKGPEDWDVLIRLSRHGHIRLVDEVILLYRRHQNNFGAASIVARQARDVMRKTYHSSENTLEQKCVVRTMWRLHQRFLIRTHFHNTGEELRKKKWKKAIRSFLSVLIAICRQFIQPRKP